MTNPCRSIPISWIERYAQSLRDHHNPIEKMLVIWEAEQALAAATLAEAIRTKTKHVAPVLVAKRPFADSIRSMREPKAPKAAPRKPTLEELL